MEASNRPKQVQHFSTHRKVQDGNCRVHQDLPDSRGMGIIDRSIRRLPSHPHTSTLKEVPKVLPQVSGVSVHIPPLRTGHTPQVFTMIVKEVKLMALSRGLRLHQVPFPTIVSQEGDFSKVNNKRRKSAFASMRSRPIGRLYSHLASEQDTTGPGQSPAQDVFF